MILTSAMTYNESARDSELDAHTPMSRIEGPAVLYVSTIDARVPGVRNERSAS